MIQVARRSINGGIRDCRMHDLLRDLAIKEAKKGAFLHVDGNVDSSLQTTARRFSITHRGFGKYIPTKHLRSLYCFAQYNERVENEQLKPIHQSFKFLRVIHIDGAYNLSLPDGIGDLIHLRYLFVSLGGFVKLPSTLSRLYNLQTLHMRGFSNSEVQIPDVRKMKQLRHMRITNGVFPHGGKGQQVHKLTNLQTLSSIWVGDWVMDDLAKLTALRKLGLRGDLNSLETTLSDSIAKLTNLRTVWFDSINVNDPIPISPPWSNLLYLETLYLYGHLAKLPEFPSSLTKLVLKYAALVHDPVTVLEKLPNLKYLNFMVDSYLGEKMSCSSTGFPKLTFLQIECFRRLEEWTIEEGAMPNLRYLQIYQCDELKMVPEGLRHLTALQELVLSGQPYLFCERVGKEGEDYYKIQHIPSVTISMD